MTFSVLLRPSPPRAAWSWLPLLTGLAVRQALNEVCELEVDLKWPNDLLVEGKKLAGLLAEVHGDALVMGVGLNVSTRAEELLETGTSLALAGAAVLDREILLRAILRRLGSSYDAWSVRGGDGSALRGEYAAGCVTLGAAVRVTLTGGRAVEGDALEVDGDGHLVVLAADGARHVVSSGDVEHVRPRPT